MENIKMIKNDALINIQIGAGFMRKLQEIFVYFTSNITLEQIQEYKRQAESGEEFTEEWMKHVTTISVLIKELETKAEEQGFTYEGDISTLTEGSPLPQSPEQPE